MKSIRTFSEIQIIYQRFFKHRAAIDTILLLRYKFFMSKRILFISLITVILISSCTRSYTTTSIPNLANPQAQSTPFPTVTPTPTPEVRYSNGEKLLISGDYDAAYWEFQLTSGQTTDPELMASSLLGMGRALLYKKDYYGAINQFSALLNNIPSGEARNTAFFFLAKAYDALEQHRLAADAYASYITALPGPLNSEILEMQGNALMKNSDFSGALSAYEKALTNASGNRVDELQLKVAQAASAAGQNDNAINIYLGLQTTSLNSYTKSQANLLLGRIYLQMGEIEQAYARFQDSVNNYPEAYDSYSALVQLVEDGQPVNQLMRGIIDYNVGQYGIAIEALGNYLLENPVHDATPHVYLAKSLFELGRYDEEIAEWQEVINEHSAEENIFFQAYDEISFTQWLSLNQYLEAAQTCLTYAASVPTSLNAPKMLEKAARIYVDGGYLTMAVAIYEQLFSQYPGAEQAYPGLFNAGILYYRMDEFSNAQLTFQRLIVLTENPGELAAASLWVAKSLEKQGKIAEAGEYYLKAATADPTGYYSIRAAQIINNQSPFPPIQNIDLAVDYKDERVKADRWMRDTFLLDSAIDLNSAGDLASNISWQRAEVFTKLDMRTQARSEFEVLRASLIGDAVNTYRLMNRTLDLGYYYTATYASRHVLDLAGLSQTATLTEPPILFNHIRFGPHYRDLIVPTALERGVDPILVYSLIRQESLFDSSIVSVAAAQGLMQITPDTAMGIVANYGWPPNFTTNDLNRPMVNIRLGVRYLKSRLDLYDGDVYAALAGYNAGDGAATRWKQLSGGDHDLFIEIINYSETKNYIKSIVENYAIYESIYSR